MTDEGLAAVESRCDALHALVTDLAACSVLSWLHQGRGDLQAVEGCRQTAVRALDAIQEHCTAIYEAVKKENDDA